MDLDALIPPAPSASLILGPVGAGKSLLAQQFILNGLSSDQRCVYFCLDHAPQQLRLRFSRLAPGLELSRLELEGKLILVDAFLGRYGKSEEQHVVDNPRSPICLLSKLDSLIKSPLSPERILRIDRLVFDSISSVAQLIPFPQIYELAQRLHGIASLACSRLVVICTQEMLPQQAQVALAQIFSNLILMDGSSIQISKSEGYLEKTRFSYRITQAGIELQE